MRIRTSRHKPYNYYTEFCCNFFKIENIAKTEASSDVQVVLDAVKKSFEKFKQDVKNEGKDVNNIFTDNINSPNVLINKIYDEHTSLDGEAKECYQSIIRMTIEALCKPENVELFINQNHALVRLLQKNTEIFKQLKNDSTQIDELLSKNYLTKSEFPLPSTKNPFIYSNENIGFYGRENELEEIEKFMMSENEFTFWSITGKGGTGKSKLALHIAKRYYNRGWVVIWCRTNIAYDDILCKDFVQPTLFIFDYAGSRIEEIRKVMTQSWNKNQNVRLLFVERDKYSFSSSIETWYSKIFRDLNVSDSYKEREYSSEPINLGALDDEAIKKLLDDFAKVRAKELKIDKSTLTDDEKEKIIKYVKKTLPKRKENADFSDRCLFILFTADACLRGESYSSWDVETLLSNYIERYTSKLPSVSNLISHTNLLAIATATGGIDIEEDDNVETLSGYIEKLKEDFGYDEDVTNGQAFIRSLCEKDESDSIITPMYPDLVGEYFFISRINSIPERTAKSWIKNIFLNEKYREYFATFLGRSLVDWYSQDTLNEFIDRVLTELSDNSKDETGLLAYLADLYSTLASIYSLKGNYIKPVEYYEEALKIYKKVLTENHSDLASLYNNLGVAYADKGDKDKALEQYEKALKIREEVLPEKHPDIAS